MLYVSIFLERIHDFFFQSTVSWCNNSLQQMKIFPVIFRVQGRCIYYSDHTLCRPTSWLSAVFNSISYIVCFWFVISLLFVLFPSTCTWLVMHGKSVAFNALVTEHYIYALCSIISGAMKNRAFMLSFQFFLIFLIWYQSSIVLPCLNHSIKTFWSPLPFLFCLIFHLYSFDHG